MSAPITSMTPVTPITPPPVAERLLESLGATPDFRDALLGDMAEELVIRAAWDGERAARRWYRREALRVASHLLRDGVRQLRWADVRRLAGVVASAYVFTMVLGAAVFAVLGPGTTLRVFEALGFERNGMWIPWQDPLRTARMFAVRLAFAAVGPAIGGYLAAWIDDRAPLVAAVALAAAWACVPLAAIAFGPSGPGWPAWLQLAQAAVVFAGATLGGMRRVATRRCSASGGPSPAASRVQ